MLEDPKANAHTLISCRSKRERSVLNVNLGLLKGGRKKITAWLNKNHIARCNTRRRGTIQFGGVKSHVENFLALRAYGYVFVKWNLNAHTGEVNLYTVNFPLTGAYCKFTVNGDGVSRRI